MTRNFDTAARRGSSAVNNPVEIQFTIDGEELTAYPPTTGQLVLFMADSTGGMSAVQGMFDFLDAVLDEDGVAVVKEKLSEGVELDLVVEIITYLIEEWSSRPTKPSSSSPGSRKSTGRTSTAKPRKKAATRSTSK